MVRKKSKANKEAQAQEGTSRRGVPQGQSSQSSTEQRPAQQTQPSNVAPQPVQHTQPSQSTSAAPQPLQQMQPPHGPWAQRSQGYHQEVTHPRDSANYPQQQQQRGVWQQRGQEPPTGPQGQQQQQQAVFQQRQQQQTHYGQQTEQQKRGPRQQRGQQASESQVQRSPQTTEPSQMSFPQKQAEVHELSKQTDQIQISQKPSSPTSQQSEKQEMRPSEKAQQFEFNIPKRKHLRQTGTKGRPIRVETNYLPLTLSNNFKSAVQYDVVIQPDKPKKLFRKIMEEFRKKCYPKRYPSFDGNKIMFSSTGLPFGDEITEEVDVADEDRMRRYKVTVKFAANVDLTVLKKYFETPNNINAQTAIQCLDVVFRNAPSLRCVPVGRSFFVKPANIIELGEGMEMYYGFYQSAILGWKPFLNVDVAHKAFPKTMNVLELITDLTQKANLGERIQNWEFEALNKFIKNIKVRFEIPNNPATKRTYKVNGVDEPANVVKFTDDNKKEWTVAEYFKVSKKYNLKYPHLPCLWVGPIDKKIRVPLELCTVIEGQVINRAMTPQQTSKMIRCAATSTDVRKDKIHTSIRQAKYNEDPCIKEFGISIDQNFYQVEGRILDPPDLMYKRIVKPSKGVWQANEFKVGVQLNNWGILCLDRRTRMDKLNMFAKMMKDESRRLGMKLAQEIFIENFDFKNQRSRKQELVDYIQRLKSSIKLIIVVIPEDKEIYGIVKQVSELMVGVLTQCVKGNTVFKVNPSTVKNILLKVNAKLDGINHSLATRPECLKRPCIIMGADVTHPSPDSRSSEPSVAAVTASHDPTAFKYNISWRLQPATKEIISDLTEIVKEHLIFFYKQNKGIKPEHIIFFRDGVSEGQFQFVLNEEITAIRKACTELEKGGSYRPSITFLVVQKRHHTRFFPTSDRDIYDMKNKNVPAGTVVDTEITHPTDVDFYLVSHSSIQGVARPTRYRKLWDDKNMSEDDLEELTYYLCHLFSRCTRSVSYPAPTYYAHLAAARAKVYCGKENINLNKLDYEQQKRIIKPEIVKELPMFFV